MKYKDYSEFRVTKTDIKAAVSEILKKKYGSLVLDKQYTSDLLISVLFVNFIKQSKRGDVSLQLRFWYDYKFDRSFDICYCPADGIIKYGSIKFSSVKELLVVLLLNIPEVVVSNRTFRIEGLLI